MSKSAHLLHGVSGAAPVSIRAELARPLDADVQPLEKGGQGTKQNTGAGHEAMTKSKRRRKTKRGQRHRGQASLVAKKATRVLARQKLQTAQGQDAQTAPKDGDTGQVQVTPEHAWGQPIAAWRRAALAYRFTKTWCRLHDTREEAKIASEDRTEHVKRRWAPLAARASAWSRGCWTGFKALQTIAWMRHIHGPAPGPEPDHTCATPQPEPAL